MRTVILPNTTTGTPAQRLHRALAGNEQAQQDTVAAENYRAAVSASVIERELVRNPTGTQRLLADIAAAGTTVTPRRARRAPLRIGRLLAAGAVALIAAAGATPAPAAQAAPVLTRAAVVVISSQQARVTVDTISTAAGTGHGGHGVAVQVGAVTLWGCSPVATMGPAPVHVTGIVPSIALTPGITKVTVTDIGDGKRVTMPVQVLRQSRVAVTSTVPFPGGVAVTGKATHYDPRTGRYEGDQQSQVALQQLVGNRWVTVQNLPTAADGSVVTVIPAAGATFVRLVRAPGATVTGATSASRMMTALPLGPARGYYPGDL